MINRLFGISCCVLGFVFFCNVSAQHSLVEKGTTTAIGSFSFISQSPGNTTVNIDAGMDYNIQDHIGLGGRLGLGTGGGFTSFSLSAGPSYIFGNRSDSGFPFASAGLGVYSATGFTDVTFQVNGGYDMVLSRSTIIGMRAGFFAYFGDAAFNQFRISADIGFIVP